MTRIPERRSTPRVQVAGRFGGSARATLEVRLLDLSSIGARIEHLELLRPDSSYTLEFSPEIGPLVLSVHVIHSAIVGTEQSPKGERLLRYHSGLAFVDVTEEQRAVLAGILERLTSSGGLGDEGIVL